MIEPSLATLVKDYLRLLASPDCAISETDGFPHFVYGHAIVSLWPYDSLLGPSGPGLHMSCHRLEDDAIRRSTSTVQTSSRRRSKSSMSGSWARTRAATRSRPATTIYS